MTLRRWLLSCLVFSLGFLLVGCSGEPSGPPRITTGNEFADILDKVHKMTEGPLTRAQNGEELSEADRSELVEAARLTEGMIKYKPNNFATHMLAGRIYMALEEFQSAEIKFRDCVAAVPEDSSAPVLITGRTEALALHGEAFEKLGAYEAAAAELQKALDAEPNNPNYLASFASANVQIATKESLVAAREALDLALEIDAKHPRALALKKFLDSSGKDKAAGKTAKP